MHLEVLDGPTHVAVLAPLGRVDVASAPDVSARSNELLRQQGRGLVFDLSGVEFLDSAGLAVLAGALKRARAAGSDVKLVAPDHEGVRRILRLTSFDRVFDIAPSVAEAVAAFGASGSPRSARS